MGPPTNPIGLYLHVPFCETKCGYCDFYSVAVKDRNTAPLVERVVRELTARVEPHADRIRTVFIGGGTPTILPAPQLAKLLGAVRAAMPMDRIDEFTVEANPATIDAGKAELLTRYGVNRVSMGAQSFRQAELDALERIHAPDDIAPSVATLRHAGIPQLNLDLIFGIPSQTMVTWPESLTRAIDLAPDHFSCYGLTYEPGTRLTAQRRAGRVQACDEQLEAEMYLHAIDALADAGYRQYETSSFARPGCECRHNLIYWRNQPYIGVGPSAAGCVEGRRYKNIADVAGYVRAMDEHGHAEAEAEIVVGETLMLELLLMQLRLVEGLSIAGFHTRTGLEPVALFGATLSSLVDRGLVEVSTTHIAATRTGRLLVDRIISELACCCGQAARRLPVLS